MHLIKTSGSFRLRMLPASVLYYHHQACHSWCGYHRTYSTSFLLFIRQLVLSDLLAAPINMLALKEEINQLIVFYNKQCISVKNGQQIFTFVLEYDAFQQVYNYYVCHGEEYNLWDVVLFVSVQFASRYSDESIVSHWHMLEAASTCHTYGWWNARWFPATVWHSWHWQDIASQCTLPSGNVCT